jgi:pyruvate formate lyase activating enzyme
LHYVYAGNIPSAVGDFENTRCPACAELLVERAGFRVLKDRLSGSGRCPACATTIAGVWKQDADPA